jgi:hypothetical protein
MVINRLDRRTFLRAAGVCIGLPLLDAMLPVGLGAEKKAEAASPKRLLVINKPLGLYGPNFFPTKAGKDYDAPRYLKPLKDHRADFTVFSGMSHKGYPGGHHTEVAVFTGVAPEGVRFNDIRNTISLDQEVAAKLGGETRFPYLSLGTGSLSWNRKGVKLPMEERATRVFKSLFIDGTKEEVAREMQRIKDGESILDGVREQAKSLSNSLGASDRERLDLLLSSIREAEGRLKQDLAWVKKPKPKVTMKPPTDDYFNDLQMLERSAQWFDVVRLGFQTDSVRVVALSLWSHTRVNVEGVQIGHHDATHHGQDESKLKQLALIEEAEMTVFGEFLSKMKQAKENDKTLLDRTATVLASNMGNASAHTCDNLPVLLAGGGFKHAGHVAFDRKDNKPLSNLFVRVLRQVGVEADRFGSSTGALTEV